MASRTSSGANSTRDGADTVGDAFQLVAQGLAQLQEALRLQKQEAERKTQEALTLQEERTAAVLREMERKLQEKDDAIRALQQRLDETQEGVASVEERTTAPEGSGREGRLQRLEGRVEKVEASLQSAVHTFMPRVEALLNQLEEPQSPRASLATAASTSAAGTREAPATGGAAAGGREEPPSSTPTSSGAGHQGAAADEEERARQEVRVRVREVELRVEEARNAPSALGEQLCDAADYGRLRDVRRLTDSGADVNYTDSIGYTPLMNAVTTESVDVVSLLLRRGADVNAVNCSGDSALHFAAMRDLTGRCVELLVRAGADINARDFCGMTPLHRAAYHNNEEAVRALLAAGANRDLKPWEGRFKDKSPFDIARFSRTKDLLRL